jgi:hypothetical protein
MCYQFNSNKLLNVKSLAIIVPNMFKVYVIVVFMESTFFCNLSIASCIFRM